MDDSVDPIGPIAQELIQMHEVYLAAIKAGFTESQAMQVVLEVLSNALKGTGTS